MRREGKYGLACRLYRDLEQEGNKRREELGRRVKREGGRCREGGGRSGGESYYNPMHVPERSPSDFY